MLAWIDSWGSESELDAPSFRDEIYGLIEVRDRYHSLCTLLRLAPLRVTRSPVGT